MRDWSRGNRTSGPEGFRTAHQPRRLQHGNGAGGDSVSANAGFRVRKYLAGQVYTPEKCYAVHLPLEPQESMDMISNLDSGRGTFFWGTNRYDSPKFVVHGSPSRHQVAPGAAKPPRFRTDFE